jgi:hypothetical protein
MDRSKYTVSVNARLVMLYTDRNLDAWKPTMSAWDRKYAADRNAQIARLEALQAAGKGHEPS